MRCSFYPASTTVLMITVAFMSCEGRRNENSSWQLVDVSQDSAIANAPSADTLYDFHLTYCFSGMGVNMGTMQPYFEIMDSVFVYSSRHTSKIEGLPEMPTDTIRQGIVRPSTIDSLLNIVAPLQQKEATQLNFSVPDGGLVSISIKTDDIDFHHTFENCSDPTMKAIVAILNTYTAPEKLILYDLPCEDDFLQMGEDFMEREKSKSEL